MPASKPPKNKESSWTAFVSENAVFVFGGAFAVLALVAVWLAPPPPQPQVVHERIDAGATTNTSGVPALRIGDASYALNRMVVGAIQPTMVPDSGGGSMLLQYLELVAPPGKTAIIGGLPEDVGPDLQPAPIVITDCILEKRIKLGPNVTLGPNVIYE